MKNNVSFGAHTVLFAAAIILALLPVGISLRLTHGHHIPMSFNGEVTSNGHQDSVIPKDGAKEELGRELYTTGSSLPDCSHACGPCFPCKRVMVSFKCSIAESCPIVYRCMCKGKYYHVPSN